MRRHLAETAPFKMFEDEKFVVALPESCECDVEMQLEEMV